MRQNLPGWFFSFKKSLKKYILKGALKLPLGCHHWAVSHVWSSARLRSFFDAVNTKKLFLKLNRLSERGENYSFESTSSRGEFHNTCDITQHPFERMTGKYKNSFQQTKAKNVCTRQVQKPLKIHAHLLPLARSHPTGFVWGEVWCDAAATGSGPTCRAAYLRLFVPGAQPAWRAGSGGALEISRPRSPFPRTFSPTLPRQNCSHSKVLAMHWATFQKKIWQ